MRWEQESRAQHLPEAEVETAASNWRKIEDLLEDEGYPFKKINKDSRKFYGTVKQK